MFDMDGGASLGEQLVENEIGIANYSVIFYFIHTGQTSESAPPDPAVTTRLE